MPITRAYAQAAEPGNFFVAGKNKLINGDFNINQRGFTSVTTDGTYTFDRWRFGKLSGTVTVTPQTFTTGSAPVAGYEGKNFIQIVTTGQTGTAYAILDHPIESVRTLAGQTATYSFWARVTSGTAKIAAEFFQDFGSGGSSFNNVYGTNVTVTTSWARYSITYNIPSISGKTIGTNDYVIARLWLSASSDWNANTGSIGIQNNTFQIWGCQVEAGAVATPFTTASGSLQGELALCQRYYWQGSGFQQTGGTQTSANETSIFMPLNVFNAVPMRTTPTPSITGTSYITDFNSNLRTVTSLAMVQTSMVRVNYDSTKLTSATPYGINVTGAGASFIFSSEL